jgi:hypothetical protein
MRQAAVNPIIVGLMFIARCLIPLAAMLGISYLLRRLGLIKDSSIPENEHGSTNSPMEPEGGIAHDNS